jgi:asparagine synthase (glutamine-hydrolysing)
LSGILGCLSLDGAPVDGALLERMRDRLAHRGPDGSGIWTGGAAGLGHLAFHTTPESVHERQPLASDDGNLHLTLDGRVDNRAELLADLRAKGFEPRDDTDAELVLQAYRCWAEDCPVHLIGDFAFAIWDAPARRLFCARDIAGTRQFYYFRDTRMFLWATEWRALFEHAAVSRSPNLDLLARALSCDFVGDRDTLFRYVARLQAGHSLIVKGDALHLRRYWDVDVKRAIRYRSDDEYGEHFRSVFGEAVCCRMRSQVPVAADLSGGLDSSSIVGMVEALRAEGGARLPALELYSLSFPGLACDERPFVEAVARRWNLEPHYCNGAVFDGGHYDAQVREEFGLPHVPNVSMLEPMRRQQAARGIRVALDGIGGDEWFAGSKVRLADLLRRGRVLAAIREALAGRRVTAYEHSPLDLLRFGLWPLLPYGIRAACRRLCRRTNVWPFVAPGLARHLPPVRNLWREQLVRHCGSYELAGMYALLHGVHNQIENEEVDCSNARLGIEARRPFMDRRLIEFAFALPPEQRWRGYQTKFVLRHAMRGLLPGTVAARVDKADFSHTVAETLRGLSFDVPVENSTLERLGWVRGAEARQVYTTMLDQYNKSDLRYGNLAWPVWWLYAVEHWLNGVVLQR